MDTNTVEQNVDTLFHGLENFTQKEGVLGKPYEHEGKTLIPVISVTLGYGSGNTAAKGQQAQMMDNAKGGALGLGAKLSADAIVVIDNNNISLLPVGTTGNVGQIIDKIPQIMAGMNQNKPGNKQQQ